MYDIPENNTAVGGMVPRVVPPAIMPALEFLWLGQPMGALKLMGCFNFAISATAISLSSEPSVSSSDSTSTKWTEEEGDL
ncbi:unnamed protein product [Prunus armeniaca]